MVDWKPGFSNNGVAAKDADAEIRRLVERDGVATPENIVDAARPVTSIIHDLFDWDDSNAAEKYRRWQARQMVTAIRVEISEPTESSRVPIFVSVVMENSRGYVGLDTIVDDVDAMKMVINEALKGLEAWQRRFEAYSSLSPARTYVLQAIESIRSRG